MPPTATKPTLHLLLAVPSDIPTLSSISHAAFQTDSHTRLKTLVTGYNHGSVMSDALSSWIRDDGKGVVIKAVTGDGEGEIVGWAAWAFKGFTYPPSPLSSTTTESEWESGRRVEKDAEDEKESEEALPSPPPVTRGANQSKIQHLSALTSSAMLHYSTLLTPPLPQKTLVLYAINSLPSYQSQGIGLSLLKWGTDIADKEGAGSWVSSSHDGYRVFEKAGYKEVGRLSVDLGDFVEEEQRGEQEWGDYVWRYLRRGVGGR